MKVWIVIVMTLFASWGNKRIVECKLNSGRIVYVTAQVCQNLKGRVPLPTVTPTSTPLPTIAPTNTPTPTPSPTPSPTPFPTPIPLKIDKVLVHNCTVGSSCYGWLTGVEAIGTGFATDSAIKLKKVDQAGGEYLGSYQGGDGQTKIITDFYNLPKCAHFDVLVFGSTGTTTFQNTITSVCP